jgi:glycosyltransferase involved in cell wall biosynthesis
MFLDQVQHSQDSRNALRVLQIIGDLDIGGGQEVVRTLVEYLASKDCVPIVCTFKDGPLRQAIEQSGITVEVLPPRRYSIVVLPLFILDMARIWWSLVGLVHKYRVEVIQTHLLRSLDFLVLLLRFTTNVRVVIWTFHSANFSLVEAHLPKHKWLFKPKRYAHNLLYRLSASLVSSYIAVSEEVKTAMVRTIGPIHDKIVVISNGVDLRRYEQSVDKLSVRTRLGLDLDARLIAVVGTLKEPKGHCYLVEAMTDIVRRHPEVHALFIGDGNLRDELKSQVERLALKNYVHFLGNRQDVPDLLAASDLFVLPSLWEGLSMALLEAMASDKPIVATSVAGTNQVLIPGKTGLVVPPGDVRRLAEAIEELLSDSARAEDMAHAARKDVEIHYSAQKQADEHLTLYRHLLTQPVSTYSQSTTRTHQCQG